MVVKPGDDCVKNGLVFEWDESKISLPAGRCLAEVSICSEDVL